MGIEMVSDAEFTFWMVAGIVSVVALVVLWWAAWRYGDDA